MNAADRCPGSLQQTLADNGRPSPCPVCSKPVTVIRIDGRPCLIEHAPRRDEAQPIGLWL